MSKVLLFIHQAHIQSSVCIVPLARDNFQIEIVAFPLMRFITEEDVSVSIIQELPRHKLWYKVLPVGIFNKILQMVTYYTLKFLLSEALLMCVYCVLATVNWHSI